MFEPILLRRADLPRSETIGVYLANGGYQALKKALTEYRPEQLVDLVRVPVQPKLLLEGLPHVVTLPDF